jgi:amiloride-sensitive sodium channel
MDCKDLFSTSETYQGYCCSFNIKKPLKAGGKTKKKEIVRKTKFFGPGRGLSVVLNPLIEKDAMTTVNSEGMKILINEFDLFPSEKTIERMLPSQQETYVEIRPERTISSAAISALPISDRGCVFGDEHPLR